MTPEQLKQMEIIHNEIQDVCNKSLTLGCLAVEMSRELSKALEKFKASLPKDSDFVAEIDKVFSEGFASWIPEYLAIAALPFAEPLQNTKASVLQKAFKILDITPNIIQEDKSNGT